MTLIHNRMIRARLRRVPRWHSTLCNRDTLGSQKALNARGFRMGVVASIALLVSSLSIANDTLPASKTIGLHNLHTGERLRVTYWQDGRFLSNGLTQLNNVLRDHRRDEIARIDPRLFELLYALRESVGNSADFEVISGYRSPQTNQNLAAAGRQVASKSQHILGKAIDIRLPGTSLATLHEAAVALKLGGVGLYQENDFIHVDLGRVRYW